MNFEGNFLELIHESQSISIVYSHKYFSYDDRDYINFEIVSVNNCTSHFTFKKRLQELSRKGIKNLHKSLLETIQDDQLDYLESVKQEIEALSDIVEDDVKVDEENEYGPREEYKFKSFVNPILTGSKDENLSFYKTNILFHASYFAEIWLEVIDETRDTIDFLIHNVLLGPKLIGQNPQELIKEQFIDYGRIEELKELKKDNFDLSKLIKFCEEINIAYNSEMYLATGMIARAIIDHIPPVFNKQNFSAIVGGYGSKSFQRSMKILDTSLRNISDNYLHNQIRRRESLPTKIQVNFSHNIDLLLAEIIVLLK